MLRRIEIHFPPALGRRLADAVVLIGLLAAASWLMRP